MGHIEGKLIDDLSRAGQPLPDKIQNAPTLLPGLDLYYNAFQDLSTCRSHGMSLGPIPWTAINEFCRTYGIKGVQHDDMVYHVHELDEAYRNHVNKKADGKRKK